MYLILGHCAHHSSQERTADADASDGHCTLTGVASVTPLTATLSIPGQLKSALSKYVARLEGVKLLRSNKRLGAIKARMLGATRATGDVLVFMDSHCECHPGWLEPLLSRIAGDR